MRFLEQIPKTVYDWRLVVGLGMLWFPLMVSPYYPFWLSPSFSQSEVQEISLWHAFYSVVLIVAFLLIIVFRKRQPTQFVRVLLSVCAAGATALALLFMFIPAHPIVQPIIATLTTVFCGLYVPIFLVAWGLTLVQTKKQWSALTLCFSFIFSCVLWGIALLPGTIVLQLVTALSPLVSLWCLPGAIDLPQTSLDNTVATDQAVSLKTLPLGIIGICIGLVYYAALSVRVFTTMGLGTPSLGDLGVVPQEVTVWGAFVVVATFCLVFGKRDASTVNVMLLVTALALIYMGALLIITLAEPSGWLVLGAKRILVAAQHSTEVLLFAVLAEETARRNLSSQLVFGIAGIVACAGPQFLSLDILHFTGLMRVFAGEPHIAVIASVGAFLIAALAMAMLATYARRLVGDVEVKGDEWVRELCLRATAAYEVTPRELDVVVLTYRGYSAPNIAKKLMVSESTVKAHLSHSYRKLNVHSKQELIALIDSYHQR